MPVEATPAPQPYVIALFDDLDPGGSTVHFGEDPTLWAWLHREETFPAGCEAGEVRIPGTLALAHVTVWAPLQDKAQHLARIPGMGKCHPALVELNLGRSDTLEFRAAYARLCRAVDAGRVIEGNW